MPPATIAPASQELAPQKRLLNGRRGQHRMGKSTQHRHADARSAV